MDLNEMGRSWAHQEIDHYVIRGWIGLGILMMSPIVADVISFWLGCAMATIGAGTFIWAWVKLTRW